MDLEAVSKAAVAVGAPLATLVTVGGRRRRLRAEIRENLALVKEIQQDPVLSQHTGAAGWLLGKITVDVARLSGQSLGTPKKPIPWSGVIWAALFGLAGAGLTYKFNDDGFVYYSVVPGTVAFFMAVSIAGMLTNRELPPEQSYLPPGATPLRSDSHSERIASVVALAASTAMDERFDLSEQVEAASNFFTAMCEGRYEDGLAFADDLWLLCRIQSWLWNVRVLLEVDPSADTPDEQTLQGLAESLLATREPAEMWTAFVEADTHTILEAWGMNNPHQYGAASRRRRLSPHDDLVILVDLGESGGYFVNTATQIPNAMQFLVRRRDDRWRVVSHVGTAPPVPGWPPIWWIRNDPAIENLPEV